MTTTTSATAQLDAAPIGPPGDGAEFPPKKLRLFAPGMNATTKGEFLFDDEAARKVLAAFEQHGVDLAMDFDHGSLAPPDGKKRDVPGYYRLAVEDGALYALPEWTETGLRAIKRGEKGELPEYRYTSPTFQYDPATRRVLSMGPLALVSYPATHGAKPIVCTATAPAELPPSPHASPTEKTMKTVLTALSLPESASEAEALRAVTAREAELAQLVAATGAKTPAEALGAIEAHKRDALALAALTAQVKAEAEARAKAARVVMLAEGVKAGKLTPAEAKADGEATCWLTALPNESLAAYLATRGVIAPAAPAPSAVAPAAGKLTADQETLCASMGIDPKTFLGALSVAPVAATGDD